MKFHSGQCFVLFTTIFTITLRHGLTDKVKPQDPGKIYFLNFFGAHKISEISFDTDIHPLLIVVHYLLIYGYNIVNTFVIEKFDFIVI